MSNKLSIKRVEVQLNAVRNALGTLELRELEMLEEIDRIKVNYEIQNKEIKKLEEKLQELKQE